MMRAQAPLAEAGKFLIKRREFLKYLATGAICGAIGGAIGWHAGLSIPRPPTPEEDKKPPAKPIVLGVPTALGSIEGADALRSAILAAEEINAMGGVFVDGEWRPLKVVSIDTREHEPGIPVTEALMAAEKLIIEARPHAIVVGAFRSEVLLASLDAIIAKYKIPYICSIAMSPLFQARILEKYDDYKYGFRTCLNSPYFVMYLTEVMRFLGREFGFDRAYLVVQDVLWARATGDGLRDRLLRDGWKVVGYDAYPTGATDFSASLTKAMAEKAQVIIPVFDMPQAGILLKQARAMKVPALICGFISPTAPENAWDVFEGEVEGMVQFVFEVGPIPVKAIPKSVRYNRAYGKRWGEDLRVRLSGHGPGPSYDAVYVLVEAIERAGTLDSDAVVDALKKTDTMGVIGRIRFAKDHQVVYGLDPRETAIGCAFQWVKPRKRMVVFPEVVAEGKIELPPYMKV
ncbi:MAG: ABC transporter substrate-binding protein [Candidatus Nezhaarchaeota archaeon]|nr:ABC transporter substrate-binding protein [Candidatus Nezhaarchaeota archaeon]